MKAGGAGSNPDSTTNSTNSGSVALTQFLENTGEATVSMNAIAVGLDAVENNYEKPPTLDVSWPPKDRVAAARKARKFALEAVLIRAADSLIEYTSAISSLPRFKVLTNGWEGKDPSGAEKLSDISVELFGATHKNFLIPAALLLLHWRNRIVHVNSGAKLQWHEKKLLNDFESEIEKTYSALSVSCLLCHFQEKRPTLKDVSSLIAMAINLVRQIDVHIYECKSKEDLEAWLTYYSLDELLEKVVRETKPEKLVDAKRRMFLTHARQLEEPYFKFFT